MVDEREKRIILLVASLSSFLVPFTGSSITVALPAMASQVHADAVTLGWITSAYIIAAAIFIGPVTLTPTACPALMTSVKAAFVVFTVLCIPGIGASYVRGMIHNG
jgi:MFS family permease